MKNFNSVSISDLTNNLDSKRIPLNSKERESKGSKGIYPYIGANNILCYIDEFIFDEKILCVAEDGGSWGKNEKCAFIVDEKCWVNNHAHVLTAKDNLQLEYLCYYLNYSDLTLHITGATRGKLNKIKIPLPPLETQKRIAQILDDANALRQKTEKLLEEYDTLAQSIFLDMFGDPVTNPKGLEKIKIEELISFLTSGSRGWAKYYSDSGSMFLRIQNVGYDRLKLDEKQFVLPPDSAESKRTKVQPNDMLLTITADLGRTAVVPENIGDANINQHLALLRFKKGVNPRFVSAYFASSGGQVLLKKLNKGGVKAGLNFSDIKSYMIFKVDLSLQEQFVEKLILIDRQKEIAKQELAESEDLFNCLLQKAFKGELI